MSINMEEFGKLKPIMPEEDERMIKEEKREYGRGCSRKYYETHKTKVKESSCDWRKENRERSNEISQKWREDHKDEHRKLRKGYSRKFYEEHKEEIKEYNRMHKGKQLFLGGFGEEGFSIYLLQKVNRDCKIIGIGNFRGIRTPKENRLNASRHKIKDVIILNEYFEGCEIHHLTEDTVAFIPKKLHQNIRHNLKTGKNMNVINSKVLEWIGKQESLEVNK